MLVCGNCPRYLNNTQLIELGGSGATTALERRSAAFKRLKNFATVVLQKNRQVLYLYLTPAKLGPLPAIARNVSQSGHWGTGDLELAVANVDDMDLAKPLIRMAYEGHGSREK